MELIDLQINNRHQTGSSYISAEQERKSIKFITIEDAVRYVTDMLIGFYSERSGNYNRWQYIGKSDLQWVVHTQTLDYDINLGTIKQEIEKYGEYECSGGLPHKYKIKVTKVGVNFNVEIVTYIHIVLSNDIFAWFDKEAMKKALINKFEYMNKKS